MKAGSEKKLVAKGSETKLVGKPELDLSIEKPVKTVTGKPKAGFVKMSVHRAFSLEHDGKTYAAKEGDTVEVPEKLASELEHGFNTQYQHVGLINTTNAKRHVVQRATRI